MDRKCLLLFLCTFAISVVSGAFVGVNIGLEISSLPPESDIVSILKNWHIRHVRLLDADHGLLKALANTGVEVIVGLPNDQLLRIGQSRKAAASWVKQNIATFVPATNITHIAVGSEVLTSIPNAALVLVPAMRFLHNALVASDLSFQVKISTPHSMDVIPRAFPPSTASFNSSWTPIMSQLLQFLKNTDAPFMLNAQPYFGFTKGSGLFPIEYALFQPLTPNKQIVDPNTDYSYANMFDAMIDAAHYSMQALNLSGIPILVTETGWPSYGGSKEQHATIENAMIYNGNLIRHVRNNSGTPRQPKTAVSAFIYELFNEDLKPGPISAKNWGFISPNGTAIYSLAFNGLVEQFTNDSAPGVFCVANPNATLEDLKAGRDWACGVGGANCTAIQRGQPCYDKNIVVTASYAYNDYYHRELSSGGTCDFAGTAHLTNKDPSYGSCIFAGSLGSSTTVPPGSNTTVPPGSNTTVPSGSNTTVSPGSAPTSPQSAAPNLEIATFLCLVSQLLFHLI